MHSAAVCSLQFALCSLQCAQCDDTAEAEVTGGAASGALQIAWRGVGGDLGGCRVTFLVRFLQHKHLPSRSPLDKRLGLGWPVMNHNEVFVNSTFGKEKTTLNFCGRGSDNTCISVEI